MTPDAYTFELLRTGYASVRSATCVFIRFRPDQPWEFYTIPTRGNWAGLERFYRYLTVDEGARLSAVFDVEIARKRMGDVGAARMVRSVGACVYSDIASADEHYEATQADAFRADRSKASELLTSQHRTG